MPRRSKRPRLIRPISAVLLAVVLQACVRWTQVPLEPGRLPATKRVRVTLGAGAQRVLTRPVVAGDSVVTPGELTIPVSRIRMVEVPSIDPIHTAYLGVFIVGPIALYLITRGSGGH